MLAQFQQTAASIALQSLPTPSQIESFLNVIPGMICMSLLCCLHPYTFTCSETSYPLLKILSCSAMGYAFLLRSQMHARRENFKSLFHKYEMQREGSFQLPTLLLTSNSKARIYLWFSSWNVTDFCGLAFLKSMYTV